jgi:flagellum-specific peptidoglycan hydrolase FlgJ
MTDINPTSSAGTNLFLGQYGRQVSDFFTMQPADVARPSSWNSDDVYQPTFAVPPQAQPLQGGVWSRLRSFLGFAPVQPTAEAGDRGIFNRIRRILGLTPAPTTVPLNPSRPVDLVNRTVDVGQSGTTGISTVTPAQLKALGQRDKQAFFRALLPAAIAAEKQYGVPASVTLAQAALESGWAKSPIGGYNIFGIKGTGPAGSKRVWTHEVFHGVRVPWNDKFALYHNFEEAIMAHGKLFHNGNYKKGVQEFAQNHDPYRFIDNVGRPYATDPNYARSIKKMMQDYNLVAMARSSGGT